LLELRRRRLFRVAALYVVGAWMVLQVFDLLFPRFGIPEAVLDIAFIGALLGFPVALVFGWIYDITPQGIVRTRPRGEGAADQDLSLKKADYAILASLLLVVAAIVYNLGVEVSEIEFDEAAELAADIPEHSIAVLPFENMSADPENEFFSDGITEEILNRLSAIGDLHVIARTSSFALKDSGFDVPKMAALLGVRFLLQGSVRRDGDRVRISTQLVDSLGKQLWNSSFDRRMVGVFELQQEIAETVARNIAPQIVITPGSQRSPNLDAYERYLMGHELYAKRLGGWQWASEEEFRAAIKLDPEFAAPYAELAIGLLIRPPALEDPMLHSRQADEAIETALALDPGLATAHAARGLWALYQKPSEPAAAEASLRKALELDPNLVNARNWLSGALREQGREEEAAQELLLAARIDPLATIINVNLANREMEQGKATQAEQRLLRLLKVPQPSPMTYGSLVRVRQETGRLADAVPAARQQALAWARGNGRSYAKELADAYARLGLWDSATEWYDYLEREFHSDFVQSRLARSFMLTRQGRHEEALGLFDSFLQEQGKGARDLYRDFQFAFGTVVAHQAEAQRTVRELDSLVDVTSAGVRGPADLLAQPVLHALAWSLQNLGEAERARSILEVMESWFLERERAGQLHRSSELFHWAQNALLSGDEGTALDRLLRAVGAGWRDYYLIMNEPMWAPLREQPRFGDIMSLVKADVDAQRAEAERTDPGSDFRDQLEAAIAEFHARKGAGSGGQDSGRSSGGR
jgi:TolB-like protein/Tfp pilus assembly protein PilF